MNWAGCRRHAVWVVLPVLTGVFLLWREAQAQAYWQMQVPAAVAPVAMAAQRPLPVAALALAFGFRIADAKASRRSDITLKASFVSSLGDARALVSSNAKEAIYRVGDRLPGGGVIRGIDSHAITLWVDGQEEVLALTRPVDTLLRQVDVGTPRPTASLSSILLLRNPQ